MALVAGGPRQVAFTGVTVRGPDRRRHLRETRLVVQEFSARTGRTFESARTYLSRLQEDWPLGVQCGASVSAWEWLRRFTAPGIAAMELIQPPQLEMDLFAKAARAVTDAQIQAGVYLVDQSEQQARVLVRVLVYAISRLQAILAAVCHRHGLIP